MPPGDESAGPRDHAVEIRYTELPPSTSAEPYPGFWQAVGLLVVYGVLQQIVTAPLAILDKSRNTSFANQPILIAVSFLVAGSLVLWLVCQRLKVPAREILGWVPIRRDLLLPMATSVMGQLILVVLFLLWVERHFPALIPKHYDFGLSRSPWGAVLLIAIVAPLVEETFFRGILVRGFAARYGIARGVVLGAAMFGVAHIYPVKLPGTILIGLLFGWWFVHLRSIWPGVFGHAFNNLTAALAFLWGLDGAEATVPPFTWAEPVAGVIGAVMLAWGVLVLRRKFEGLAPQPVAAASDSRGLARNGESAHC